jgi:hypothetical protein
LAWGTPGGRRSVFSRRALEHDPFELGEALAAEPKDRLEAFASELAGVEGSTELIESRPLVVEDLVARGLNQDQVPGAPFTVREPDKAFTLRRVETRYRNDSAVTRLEPLHDRRVEQLPGTRLDFVGRDPAGKQDPDPGRRQDRTSFLDDALGESVRLRRRSAHYQQQAPGRVTKTIRRTEDARSHRYIDRPWWGTVTARSL